MLGVNTKYTYDTFKKEFAKYYDNTRYYNDKELKGLETLYYYLKMQQENKGIDLSKSQIANIVKRLTVVEVTKLYVDLHGTDYMGPGDFNLIIDVIESLEAHGYTYLNYIQIGVRRERLIAFLDHP